MALVGKYKKHISTNHPTETFEVVMTEPNGDKQVLTRPVPVETIEIIENAYINIRTVVIYADHPFMNTGDPTKVYRANVTFRIYPSQQSRIENPNAFTEETVWSCSNFDVTKSTMSEVYRLLKENYKGFDELIEG